MKNSQKQAESLVQQYLLSPPQITTNFSTEQLPQSYEQQLIIKNLDSGTHEVFVNVEQVDDVTDLKQFQSNQTKITLWNSYWQEHTKIDVKLLNFVISKDKQKLQKLLQEEPIDINKYKYIDGWTLLHHAVVSSTEEIVQVLIENKIDVNITSNEMKRSALHQAVLLNKIKIVEILVNNFADPNIQDIDGNTSTHYAAQLSNSEIFQFLLNSKIKINFQLKNHQQMTILDCIRDEKLYKIVQKLYPEIFSQNQNLALNLENRRIILLNNETIIKRLSKSDLIQKFLNMKNIPRVNSQNSLSQEKNDQKLSDSIKSDQSVQKRKKKVLLGKRPSHWIQKKGQIIASQSICLMKESILQPMQNQFQNSESLENYQILRFVGSGGFAEVFLARRKRSSRLFAIKRITKAKIIQNNLKRYVYAERNIMIKCQHPFIVEAHSMFQDQAHLYISMQYCECGDLEKLLFQKGQLSQEDVKLYAAQIGLALQKIHAQNILFRDLKSSNVLIGKDGYLKISDFGLAKQSLVSFSFLGSIHYLAPQMLVEKEMKEHTKSIDWYLFGVLIYELLTGKPPFYGQKQHILFKKIKEVKPPLPSFLSKQCQYFLSRLLEKDPSKRLGSMNDFEQIKSDPWFSGIDFQRLLRKEYQLPNIQPIVKQSDLRKKLPIDDFMVHQKYEFFKQWNYVKQ